MVTTVRNYKQFLLPILNSVFQNELFKLKFTIIINTSKISQLLDPDQIQF